jgi:hypothetical protein
VTTEGQRKSQTRAQRKGAGWRRVEVWLDADDQLAMAHLSAERAGLDGARLLRVALWSLVPPVEVLRRKAGSGSLWY